MPNLRYVTVSEFVDVFPEQEQAEATDDLVGPNDEPTVDSDILERTLKYAESRVESYLVGYSLPLDEAPYALKHAIYVTAAYMLMIRADLDVSDGVQAVYDDTMMWLKKVKDGDVVLTTAQEDDEDFVGFGDRSDMRFEYFPHRDYILNNVY